MRRDERARAGGEQRDGEQPRSKAEWRGHIDALSSADPHRSAISSGPHQASTTSSIATLTAPLRQSRSRGDVAQRSRASARSRGPQGSTASRAAAVTASFSQRQCNAVRPTELWSGSPCSAATAAFRSCVSSVGPRQRPINARGAPIVIEWST